MLGKNVDELAGSLGDRKGLIVSHNELSGRKLFFKIQNIELLFSLWDAKIRNEGDTQTDPCQIDQKVIAT